MYPPHARQLAVSVFGGTPLHGSSWREHAACRPVDPAVFFSWSKDYAKRVCAGCPVRIDCLATALSLPSNPDGVWGGTSKWERTRMRNQSGLADFCNRCGRPIEVPGPHTFYCGTCKPAGWRR